MVGQPSISVVTERVRQTLRAAGRAPNELPSRATVGRCFTRSRQRVDEDLVTAVVAALIGDQAVTIAAWQQALRRVMGRAEASAMVTVENGLPRDLPEFIGRGDVIAAPQRVVAISGMAGVGKTISRKPYSSYVRVWGSQPAIDR